MQARLIQDYEEGTGNYTHDRSHWLGEESARTLHKQAIKPASTGELPRPFGTKLLSLNPP